VDTDITHETKRRNMRRTITIAVAAAALLFSLAATVTWLRPSVRRQDLQIARVERGSVDATLQASGVVLPEVETVLSSPVEARVLRINHRAGDVLHAGDEIVTLDTSATRVDAEGLRDRVAQKESELAQKKLHAEENIAVLAAQLEQARVDGEIVHFRAEQNQKLRAAGLVAAEADLAAAASAKKSDIQIKQLEAAVARARRTGAAEVAAAELDVRTLGNQRDEQMRQLQLAMTRSDRDGVLTWVVPEVGATIRRGDIVARVADLSTFRIVANIADVHASRLSAGMRARVKLDESTTVGGTITSIDPRMENGTAKFYVALDQATHPKLRNNLRVDVFAITGHHDNALTVARGSLAETAQGGLFVVRGDTAVHVPARLGFAGDEKVEIVSGVREGEQVVISNMSDYAGVKELRIK
jgi:HlyD family secretion protein